MHKILLVVPLCVLFAQNALAFSPPSLGRPGPINEEKQGFAAPVYDFEGIVSLSNCSGSLLRFDDSLPTDKALVLSNGHCIGGTMLAPGKAVANVAASRSFGILGSDASKIGSVAAERLLYATLSQTDISIYRLKLTYAEIEERFQTRALTLSRGGPALDTSIQILSGYWKRGFACQVEFMTPVLQEGSWFYKDSLRYSSPGCEVMGGTSGSPVIEEGTRTVVAINNTGNVSGQKCKVSNPCEINDEGEILAKKGYNYAQQTYWLYSCRNAEGQLDMTVDGCLLPKP